MSKQKHLQEGYFNNSNLSSDDIIDDINSQSTSEEQSHTLYIAIRRFQDDDFKDVKLSSQQVISIYSRMLALCNQSMFFETFSIFIYNPDTKMYEEIKSAKQLTASMSLFFAIKFTRDLSEDFTSFTLTVQKLCSIIYNTLVNNFKLTVDMINDTFIKIDDEETKISFSHLSIDNLKKLYLIIINDNTEVSHKQHSVNFHFNSSVQFNHLLSSRRLKEVKPGDILYATNDEQLVLEPTTDEKQNTPIAIAIETFQTDTHSARFIALNYLSCYSPSTGSKRPCSFVFGNMDNAKVAMSASNSQYGVNLTDFYKYMNEHPVERVKSSYVINSSEKDNFPVLESAFFYHTKGTKQGDWFVPVYYEFRYCVKENLDEINNSRNSLGLEELAELNYYTSVESDEHCCAIVDLSDYILDTWFAKNHMEDTCAIVMINVKY